MKNNKKVPWVAIFMAVMALAHLINYFSAKKESGLSDEVKQQIAETIRKSRTSNNGFYSQPPSDELYSQMIEQVLNGSQASDNENDNQVTDNQLKNVRHIYSNKSAFAALRDDGKVVTWGDSRCGGDHSAVAADLVNVKALFSSHKNCGFAALTQDHRLVTWNMGDAPELLKDELTQVSQFVMNEDLFAVINLDGSVMSWYIADHTLDDVNQSVFTAPALKNVESLSINEGAFAALTQDGTVVTWGIEYAGGNSQHLSEKLINIKTIYTGPQAFTAVTQNGELISWGRVDNEQASRDQTARLSEFRSPTKILSTSSGFAAMFQDGRAYVWGETLSMENRIPFPVSLAKKPINSKEKVIDIVTNNGAHAVLKANGKVVAWGHKRYGGDTTLVQRKLQHVRALYAVGTGFVALREDGTSIAWNGTSDHSLIIQETNDVKQIMISGDSYAVLKNDGTVVDGEDGSKLITTEAAEFIPGSFGFIVKRHDGSTAAWNYNNRVAKIIDTPLLEVCGNWDGMIALTATDKVMTWDRYGYNGEAVVEN